MVLDTITFTLGLKLPLEQEVWYADKVLIVEFADVDFLLYLDQFAYHDLTYLFIQTGLCDVAYCSVQELVYLSVASDGQP